MRWTSLVIRDVTFNREFTQSMAFCEEDPLPENLLVVHGDMGWAKKGFKLV
jgi:hypothetical protein